MSRSRTALALLGLIAASCSGGEVSSGDQTSTTTSAAGATATSEVQSTATSALPGGLSPVEVHLVSGEDPGGTQLRLAPEKGAVEHATLTITQQMEQLGLGTTRYSSQMGIEATVEDVTEEGEITTTWVYDSAELLDASGYPPESRDAIETGLQQIVGLEITQTVDNRGRPLEMDFELPAGMDPMIASSMEQTRNQLQSLEAPLPDEPVAEGAQWEVSFPIESMGLEMLTGYVYELVELDETGYVFDIEITQSMEPGQEVEIVEGATAVIDEFDSEGTGTVRGDLTRMLPIESEMRLSTRQVISAADQELVQTTLTEMTMVSD